MFPALQLLLYSIVAPECELITSAKLLNSIPQYIATAHSLAHPEADQTIIFWMKRTGTVNYLKLVYLPR